MNAKKIIVTILGVLLIFGVLYGFGKLFQSEIDCHQPPGKYSWEWRDYNQKCYDTTAGPAAYESCQTCVTGKTYANGLFGNQSYSATATMGWCGNTATQGFCMAGTVSGPSFSSCGLKWAGTIASCNSMQ